MDSPYFRSIEMMEPGETVLVVIDVQEKLLPPLIRSRVLEWNVIRLLEAAQATDVAILATEQYPQGLGETVPGIAAHLTSALAKKVFSCAGSDQFRSQLQELGRNNVLLCGAETHVCVMQTALDLLAQGYSVYVAADAVSCRGELDHDVALRRMENSGAVITTVETTLFEWCKTADAESFKTIRGLVMRNSPDE